MEKRALQENGWLMVRAISREEFYAQQTSKALVKGTPLLALLFTEQFRPRTSRVKGVIGVQQHGTQEDCRPSA